MDMNENAPKDAALPKRKRPTTKSQIEQQLKTIYEDERPGDFSKIERVRRRRWPKFILTAVFFFVLAGVAAAGIMRFGGNSKYGNNITLTVNGPATVRSGEVSEWTISYKNNDRLPIASADILLRLPPSISVLTTDPATVDKNLEWKIGTIAPGNEGKIILRGRVVESIGTDISTQAVLSYRPANFNADFQKVTSWQGNVADSIIDASLNAPDEAVPTDLADFSISLKLREDASAEATLPDLAIRFDTGNAVIVKKSDPAMATPENKTWSVKIPVASAETKLNCSGNFTSGLVGDVIVKADIGTTDANGNFIILIPLSATVKVTPGNLVLSIIRNGSAADGTIDFGDVLHISVDYENKSTKPISDAKINLSITENATSEKTSVLDWTSLSDARGGNNRNGVISWGKGQIPELATIAAGEKGTIDLSIKTVATPPAEVKSDSEIDLSATGTIGALGGKISGKTVLTPTVKTILNSDAKFFAAAAWAEGALPPKSTNQTTYKIVWTLTNSLHEISGINVNAILAPGVNWENRSNVSAGDLRYDTGSRKVIWTLNRLPTSIKSVSLEFYVSITPGVLDIGKILPLLSTTTFGATDKNTGTAITRTTAAIDTDIQSDTDNAGVVMP